MAWRNRLALALALALVTVSLTPSALAREERETYTTGADVVASCSEDLTGGVLANNYGSVCFDVRSTESQVDVTIDDVTLNGVGGAVQFLDAEGEQVGDLVSFCGTVRGVDIPEEADGIEVYVNGPLLQTLECTTITSGTTGEVLATFS